MMGELLQKIRCRKGMVDTPYLLGGILILFAVLAMVLAVYPAFVMRSGLQDVATETVRCIELRGRVDSTVDMEFDRLCQVYGIEGAELNVDGEFLSDGSRLQLQSAFTVSITADYQSSFLTVPLTGRATGRSEVYWKS